MLKREGHETDLLIYTCEDDTKILFEKIRKFKPDLVGFSVTTTQYLPMLSISEKIKEFHNLPIIFGGIHPTLLPEEVIREKYIDMICIGEGEHAMLELLNKMKKCEELNKIENLWIKEDSTVYRNRLRPLINNLDELPFPDRELFNYEKIVKTMGIGFIMASRGCPYNCAYCCNHALKKIYKGMGQYVRFRNVDNVIEEIKYLSRRYDIKSIFFHDDILPLKKEWITELCEKYKKEINIPFECYTFPNLADKAIFKMLKDAGCTRISMGIESGDEYIRNKVMKRNVSQDQIINAFRWAKECGLKTYSFNIIGLPDESRRSIWNTIVINREVAPDGLQVSFFYPFPKTLLNEYCIEKGYKVESKWIPGFFEYPVLKLRNISKAELLIYQRMFKLFVYPNKESNNFLMSLLFRLKKYAAIHIYKIGVILNKLEKALLLIKTSTRRGKLRRVINEEIFKASILLIGICGGWNFWKPRIIGVEPTNRCNLDCIMCARRYWDEEKNPLGDMSMGLFKDRILPFLSPFQLVILQCFGEPLLGQHFFEMLSECKKKGCKVQFITNGTLLKRYARKLVELQIDSIGISVDGVKSFKNIRGIEIDSIIDGIRELNLIKHQLNRDCPIIHIEFVAMKQNISELPELIDLAYKLEIEAISVVHVVIHSKQLIGQSLFMHTELANKYFNEAFLKAQKLGIRLNLPPLKETVKFCRQPFETMFINWNGDVRTCCGSTINEKNSINLGNLKDSSLAELWNCSQMRKLRMALLRRRGFPEFCKSCAMRVYSLESHIRILENG